MVFLSFFLVALAGFLPANHIARQVYNDSGKGRLEEVIRKHRMIMIQTMMLWFLYSLIYTCLVIMYQMNPLWLWGIPVYSLVILSFGWGIPACGASRRKVKPKW